MPDLLLRLSEAGVLLGYKPASQLDLELPLQDLVGRPLLEALPGSLAAAIAERMQTASDSGALQEFDYPMAVSGASLTREVRVVPAREGEFLVLIRDITSRRAAEERLRLMSKLFEYTEEGVILTDAERRILAVNQAFSRITGYGGDEVRGETPDLLRSFRHEESFYEELEATVAETGAWRGEVWNRRKSGEFYPQWLTILAVRDDAGRVCNYLQVFSDLTSHKNVEQRLDYLSHYDGLTKLPNRSLLDERLVRALGLARSRGAQLALLCVDLNRFKRVNERLGYSAGDQVLLAVAHRLQSLLRRGHTVARFGADEFYVLVEEFERTDALGELARRIVELLTSSYEVQGEEIHLAVSIGISIFPDDAREPADLIRHAAAAAQRAHNQGSNLFSFYTEEMTSQALERHRLEGALRRALLEEQFLLHYQPKVDIDTGVMRGMEALIRWEHPERGLVSPGAFVPLAEETGLIIPIGEWALEQACRRTRLWHQMGFRELRVSVNLSPLQLGDEQLIDKVLGALTRSGLPPSGLELEITESLLIRDLERTVRRLQVFRDAGISVSLDDFGTGYSSLSLLRRLPVDTLKIDKSFVDQIAVRADERAILRAIIEMGHSLDMRVVAEGVESEDQLCFLREAGCDELQGYYYSRPLPPDSFDSLLHSRTPLSQPRALMPPLSPEDDS